MNMFIIVLLCFIQHQASASEYVRRNINLTSHGVESIRSPNYPNDYNNSARIFWHITAPENHGVRILFLDFNLAPGYDILEVGFGRGPDSPGGGIIDTFTGTNITSVVLSPDRMTWLRFTSDASVTYRGFDLEISAFPQEECTGHQHRCPLGLCIEQSSVCDEVNDCLDFSDEELCPICETIPLEMCRNHLSYNSTFFPNQYAGHSVAAENIYNETITTIASCHARLSAILCSQLYPECPHYGPTRRLCYSDCMEVTAACKSPYEQEVGQTWPFDCSGLGDNDQVEGNCFGRGGDLLNNGTCGTRPGYEESQSRIIGGVNAQEGEFPWIASLREGNATDNFHFCGGTLISPEWVITAAHCVYIYTERVFFGSIILDGPVDNEVSVEIAGIFVHPDYDRQTFENDVALIKLSRPIPFSDYVRPACLADSSDELQIYSRCLIAGWGFTQEGGAGAETLKKAVVQLLDTAWCNSSLSYNGSITDVMLCAGYERGDIDSCQGDSGGPLICQGPDGRWDLVGVTSFGIGCGRPNFPGIYTRISEFQTFINGVVSGALTPGHEEIRLEDGTTVTITSPNYPEMYNPEYIMVWEITAPVNRNVRLDILNFGLEKDYDFLFVGDGLAPLSSTELARLTGTGPQPSIISNGRFMWIRFFSDVSITDIGFEAELSAVDSRDPCLSNPCGTGATCVVIGDGIQCVCKEGYTGINCDIDINECASLPCQNGGTCINSIGRYICQCRLGFSGTNCDEGGFCDLEGDWYNDHNSRITITKTYSGLLLGDYTTYLEILRGYNAPTVLVGYANQNCDFPSIGFVVARDNGQSTTTWSGQCQLCDGEEILYTTWINTIQVNTCEEIKRATRVGQDKWTRYRQDVAPRPEV